MKVGVVATVAIVLLAIAAIGAASQIADRPTNGNGGQGVTSISTPASTAPSTPSSAGTAGKGGSGQPASSSSSGTDSSDQGSGNGCTPSRTGTLVVRGTLQGFYPSDINVTVGQTVTFTMGPMAFSCAFDQVGNFTYHCADHPFMIVAVSVRQ